MTDTLFEPPPAARSTTHACTGPGCGFCEFLDGHAAKNRAVQAVRYDPRWLQEATAWRASMIGRIVTADDLIEAIGLPDGHPNQMGALWSMWAQSGFTVLTGTRPSRRDSNHARQIKEWRVIL